MNITKKVLSLVAAVAISVTGLVATGGAATAANTNVYGLNLNNSSGASNAKDFVKCGTKIYFTADSSDHGRAVFSTSATAPGAATFVATHSTGNDMANPMSLSCVGDYLVYTDTLPAWHLWAVKISTGVTTELKAPGDVSFTASWEAQPKIAAIGNKGYFLAALDGDANNQQLWSIDGTTGVVSNELSYGSGKPASLTAFGDKLYATIDPGSWNGTDGRINVYDPTAQSWSLLSYSGTMINPSLIGIYRYQNADALLMSARTGTGTSTYYVDSTGAAQKMGTTDMGGQNFVNLGERLFAWTWYGINEVDQQTGNLSQDYTLVAWQGASSVNIELAIQTGNQIFFMAKPSDSTNNPSDAEFMYKWDATGMAIRLGTISSTPGKNWIPEYPNNQGGWGRNTSNIAVGDGLILNLYLSSDIGYEPYFVHADGTTTSLGNLNTMSDGSSPDTDCMGTNGTSDFIAGSVIGTDMQAHTTLTQLTPNGAYLDYTVTDTGNMDYACAFASSGTDTYFQAWDRQQSQQTLYKMDKAGAITRLGGLPEYGYEATVVGNKYIFLDDDNYYVWAYDLATNTTTQLITGGNGSDNLSSGSSLVGVGNKAYFVAQDNNTGYYDMYSVDGTNLAAAPVKVTNTTTNNWMGRPMGLKVVGTKIYFGWSPDGTGGAKLYSLDTTSAAAPALVTDLYPDSDTSVNDYVGNIYLIGSDLYIAEWDDNTYHQILVKVVLSTKVATVQTMPNGFTLNCAAPAGGKMLLQGQDGSLKYFADGVLTDTGVTLPANDDSFCYNTATAFGTYAVMREANFNNGPFGWEPVYVGTLIPRAVKRLGQAVNEAPSAGRGTGVDTGWVIPGATTPAVDTDNPDLGTLNESMTFTGTKGSINFPDGSGFDIDAKGRIFPKVKSKFLAMTSGVLTVTYKVSGKTKVFTCKVAPFGSVKKLKKLPVRSILYKSKKACQMPAAALKALKTSVITIKMTVTMKRYLATTGKAKLANGKAIKPLKRIMTVRMSAVRQ